MRGEEQLMKIPKIGIRKPSIRGRISARISPKRMIRHRAGIKMPRGLGWLWSPKKFAYNKIYHRTTISPFRLLKGGLFKSRSAKSDGGIIGSIFGVISALFSFAWSLVLLAVSVIWLGVRPILILLEFFYNMGRLLVIGLSKIVAYSWQGWMVHTGRKPMWEVHIAGRHLRKDVVIEEHQLVELVADPSNEHDPNAVKVLSEEGHLIGFISREENSPISRWLRKGKQAYGIVGNPKTTKPATSVFVG